MMVPSYFYLLILSRLLKPAVGLQVTPNSACAKLCIDNPTTDISDPNSSSTNGSDIVCTDDAYSGTPVGQKFKSCVSCLQNSTANATNENDQEWFLYNIRYALNTCLYNSKVASEPFSTPCSISSVCGPLASYFKAGMDNPDITTQYAYCGANNESFGTNSFRDCSTCLRQSPDQVYLANQLIALDAGCIQRPTSNVLLGLDGSIFSSSHINITSPIVVTTPTKKKILTIGAISGIVAGGVVLLAILLACLFICHRRRVNQRNARVRSSLDPRYGNKDISNPLHGGFAGYSEPSPHTPAAYEAVGLIKVPQPVQRSMSRDSFNPPEYDGYHKSPALQTLPKAARQTHEEMARDLGFSMGAQHSSPPPVETRVVPMLYQPAASKKHAEYTPSEHSFISSGTSTPEPSEKTRTPHIQSVPTFAAKIKNPTQPIPRSTNLPVLASGGAPGLPSLPKRSPSFSQQSATSNSASRNFSRRQTQDLSTSRGDTASGAGSARGLSNNGRGQISGPLVSVGSRYEDEEEDAKRRRERLYRDGFKKRQEEAQRKAGNYDSEGDLW